MSLALLGEDRTSVTLAYASLNHASFYGVARY